MSNPTNNFDEFYISLAKDNNINSNKFFKYNDCSFKDLPDLMKNHNYSFSIFRNDYRKQDNFIAAQAIMLDMDSPGKVYTLKKTIAKLNKLKYNSIIITSKSHQKAKGDKEPCDRYHVLFPLTDIIKNSDDFKATARAISQEVFNGKDDLACHDSSRMFYASPENAEVHFIMDNSFRSFPVKEADDSIKQQLTRTKHHFTELNIPKTNLDLYQKHIKESGLKYIISHFNPSNGTLNLFRNENDRNPGCFMFEESNKIYDDTYNTVDKTIFSFRQIIEAEENSKLSEKEIKAKTLKKLYNDIDITKKVNILYSSEGAGKSSLIPKIIDKFSQERGVILFKSYEQLNNRIKTYHLFNPDLTVEIAYGTEKILNLHGIDVSSLEYKHLVVYEQDPESEMRYLNLEKTLENLDLPANKNDSIWKMKNKSDALCQNKLPVDLLLMTEDKFKVEILIRKNLREEPVVFFDEFYGNTFFKYRTTTNFEKINGKIRKLIKEDIFYQESWSQDFIVELIEEKYKDWRNYFNGNFIVLTTELSAKKFFENLKSEEVNIIDASTIFKLDDNIFQIWSLPPELLNKSNKQQLAIALASNAFIPIGNGINAQYNHVNLRGRNLHQEFDNQSLALFITQPCPEEVAVLRKNLNLDANEARNINMIDSFNQQTGRAGAGHRANIVPKKFIILIPSNIIYDILPMSRYISGTIHTTPFNPDEIHQKIISTIKTNVSKVKMNTSLYLKSLPERILHAQRVMLTETKAKAIEMISGLKYLRFEAYTKIQNIVKKIQQIYKEFKVGLFQNSNILYSVFEELEKITSLPLNMRFLMQELIV